MKNLLFFNFVPVLQMFYIITREALRLRLNAVQKQQEAQQTVVQLTPISGLKSKHKPKCCKG